MFYYNSRRFNSGKLYKPKDVSQMLGVTINTLQHWDREEKIKVSRNGQTLRKEVK